MGGIFLLLKILKCVRVCLNIEAMDVEPVYDVASFVDSLINGFRHLVSFIQESKLRALYKREDLSLAGYQQDGSLRFLDETIYLLRF